MGTRSLLMWAVVIALAEPLAAMADNQNLYSAARTGTQPMLEFVPWVSGEVTEAEDGPGVVITTTGN